VPEINRGVAVAYCVSPGALESAPLATFIEGLAVYTEELMADHGYPGRATRGRSACSS
jgi:hypothetical protein